ncbi:MAG: beta-carotene hydroxylase [Sphingobacteriales bacterium]|nr:beta-carotene hydroxylase [Sphingobacteriales bacterium]
MTIQIILFIASFLFMEFVAWFTHKYVMHGFLWSLHKDHHIRDGRKLEKNDWFAVIFAVPGILLTILGTVPVVNIKFSIGLGISLYGLFYFLFHDIYVHQRIRLFKNFSNRYLRATVQAHLDHHLPHSQKNYGFLIAPLSYYRQEFRKNKSQ